MEQQEEFLKLIFACEHEIRAFIGSIVRDRHGCDDLFQEVALTLWKEFHRYDRTRSFGAWARGITVMKLMQRRDKTKRLPILLSADAIEAVSRAFDRSEELASRRADALEHCLDKLPEKSRRLLELRYEQSLKTQQIADELQATIQMVYQALSRLRIRLQECVNRWIASQGLA